MRKIKNALLLLSITGLLLLAPPATTQAKSADGSGDDAIFQEELGQPDSSDEAPKPEYPYPGSAEEGFTAKTPEPSNGPARRKKDALPPVKPNPDVPRPRYLNENGDYIYDTTPSTQDAHPRPPEGVIAPRKADSSGDFHYDPPVAPQFSGRPGVEKPTKILPSGEYRYNGEQVKPKHRQASFRLGAMTPPTIVNSENGASFTDIYGSGKVPIALFDYEWHLTQKVGRLDLKFTTGFTTSSGTGRFLIPRQAPYANIQPFEKFNFLMFPNQLTVVYRFQYADDQFFVPFIEGGGGYFTFIELRDDNKPPKGGGSPAAVFAGGGSILLNGLDRHGMMALQNENGITHVWLTAEYRQFVGLEKSINFTSELVDLGFMVEF